MIATFIVVIIVMIVSIVTLFSPREEFNPEDCFSLDYIRVKLDDKIFDLPHGVNLSSVPTSERKKVFIDLPAKHRGPQFTQCQRKEHAPIDLAEYSNILSMFIVPGPIKGGFPEKVSIYPLSRYSEPMGDLITISEISKLKLLEEKRTPIKPIFKFTYVFGVGSKRREVSCHHTRCTRLHVLNDGLIYGINPIKYYYNEKDAEFNEIIPTEDVPETILPILNLVRSFRNKDAEEQAQ